MEEKERQCLETTPKSAKIIIKKTSHELEKDLANTCVTHKFHCVGRCLIHFEQATTDTEDVAESLAVGEALQKLDM